MCYFLLKPVLICLNFSFIGDLNFLDSIDYLANQFLMPIGGMMVAIFAGWFFKPDLALEEFSGIQFYIFQVFFQLCT